MLVAVGDHSLSYIMKNINTTPVLAYLEIVLGFTGFPGWYGVDEFESDVSVNSLFYLFAFDDLQDAKMTTSFWVYFSEAILDSDWNGDESNAMMQTAHDILVQLVTVLRRKCSWPPQEELRGWTKGVWNDMFCVRNAHVCYQTRRIPSSRLSKLSVARIQFDHTTLLLQISKGCWRIYAQCVSQRIFSQDESTLMFSFCSFYVLRNETLSILLDPVFSALNSSDPESVDWEVSIIL